MSTSTHIADRDIALVRDHNPLYSVVLESHVDLIDTDDGNAKGLCPFHRETKPSFHVTPARGMWYCFGCGEGGDVITFVGKLHNLTFAEAVERLAKRAHVSLSYEPAPNIDQAVIGELAPTLAEHAGISLDEAKRRMVSVLDESLEARVICPTCDRPLPLRQDWIARAHRAPGGKPCEASLQRLPLDAQITLVRKHT